MASRLTFFVLSFLAFLLVACGPARERNFSATAATTARAKVKFKETTAIFDSTFAKSAEGEVEVTLYKNLPPPVVTLVLEPDGMVSFKGFGWSWHGEQKAAPAPVVPLLHIAKLYGTESSLPNGRREVHSPTLRVGMDVRKGRLRSACAVSNDGLYSAAVDF